MTTKDDSQFSEAYHNVDKRKLLLKQLIKTRRGVVALLLFTWFTIAFALIVDFIANTDIIKNGTIFCGMITMFWVSQVDTKIKILLTQK